MLENYPEPLRLKPALIERVWAGHRLRELLHKQTPDGRPVGEAWELADHPSGPSGFADGEFRDSTFGAVFRSRHRDLFNLSDPGGAYPLLVKFIDAGESLSIQVHPDDENASRHRARGKSECWYVIDCEPGSQVLCGCRPGITPTTLRQAALDGRLETALARIPIQPGTFVNVPAGTIHAILKGTLVCEISQTSNEIARLWDWGRIPTPDRKLDIESAIGYTRFQFPETMEPGERPYSVDTAGREGNLLLVRNRFFEVRLVSLCSGSPEFPLQLENPHGAIVCVVGGSGGCAWSTGRGLAFRMGETWLLPAGLDTLRLRCDSEELRLLVGRPLAFG